MSTSRKPLCIPAGGVIQETDGATFVLDLACLGTEIAHRFLAGPVSGVATTPSFRTLDASDIPALLGDTNIGNNMTVFGNLQVQGNTTFTNDVPAFPAQANATLFAGPTTGANATPAFRAQVAGDLPGGNWIGNTSTNLLVTAFTGNVTHANSAVWQDTTLGNTQNFVAIPAAGTYLIGYSVHCTFQSAVVADEMCFRLFDETAAAECANSSSFSQQILVANASQTIQTSHTVVATFTGATNVRLEMLWSTTAGSGGPTTANISSGPLGHSTIFFVRIA